MSLLTRLCLALGVIGCVLSFLGGRDYWLASKASSTPDQMTAEQLIARGAEGNPFVEISAFMPASNFVYEEKNGRWTEVFIPFGPLDENAAVTTVKAVFKSTQVKSEIDIMSTFGGEKIQGMVMNKIESLGSEEKKLLSESFPGANMADVLIVDVTKNPADMKSRSLASIGGGIACLLGCGGLGFVLLVKKR
jgi:hypothetical protein